MSLLTGLIPFGLLILFAAFLVVRELHTKPNTSHDARRFAHGTTDE